MSYRLSPWLLIIGVLSPTCDVGDKSVAPWSGRWADCDDVRACVRRVLPVRFDPVRHSERLKAAADCLQFGDGGKDTCLSPPMQFGTHEATGRPVVVRVDYGTGCLPPVPLPLVVEFLGVDEATCRCIGLRSTGSYLSDAPFAHCRVIDTRRAAGQSIGRPAILESLNVPAFGIGRVIVDAVRGLTLAISPPLTSKSVGPDGRIHFALDSLTALDATSSRSEHRTELRLTYQAISRSEFSSLFAAKLEELESGKPEIPAGDGPYPSVQLAWNKGTGHHVAQVARGTDTERFVRAGLQRLPSLSFCNASPELPYGGAACLPGMRDGQYVALREGDVEVRAITPEVSDALCSGLAAAFSPAH